MLQWEQLLSLPQFKPLLPQFRLLCQSLLQPQLKLLPRYQLLCHFLLLPQFKRLPQSKLLSLYQLPPQLLQLPPGQKSFICSVQL
jgi:hypothetical protein